MPNVTRSGRVVKPPARLIEEIAQSAPTSSTTAKKKSGPKKPTRQPKKAAKKPATSKVAKKPKSSGRGGPQTSGRGREGRGGRVGSEGRGGRRAGGVASSRGAANWADAVTPSLARYRAARIQRYANSQDNNEDIVHPHQKAAYKRGNIYTDKGRRRRSKRASRSELAYANAILPFR